MLVSESVDRLGRKLADVAALFDQLSYLGIKIHTVSTGEVTTLSIGMLGTMAQMYLSDLRDKTRRGQLGRVLQGKTPGGKAYGYDVVPPADPASKGNRGERRINPTEAPIVTRIFKEYADGLSPRAIAKRFNAEGLPGPGGRTWRDTTIRGQFERGTGILNNPVYVGRLVWNRTSYVKNPKTGKRVARINPPDQHEVVAVPDLRILSDELWDKVKARQEQARFEIARDQDGNALNRVHRLRRRLHGRRQGPLRLRRAPVQGNLRQRTHHQTSGDRRPRPRRSQGQADGAGTGRGIRRRIPARDHSR